MPKDTDANTGLVSLGQFSSAGHKPENQDFHGAILPEGPALLLKGITLAVADGISSSPVSAAAAETAVKSLLTDYYSTPDAWTVKTAASRVISATNAWLASQNSSVGDINAGQVCTLTALILKGRTGHIFHVGDSRVSRLTGGALEPLTKDHRRTLGPGQSYLGRALGIDQSVEIDYRRIPLSVGDVFLLTTDGVHEFIDAQAVQQALTLPKLDAAAAQLADVAKSRGSDDNLTVQIVRVDALPQSEAELDMDLTRLPIPPIPNAGDVIDGFRIIRPLAQSARSHVFLAADESGRKVALKIPASDMTQDPETLRRFVLEEWVARRVSSAHILRAADMSRPRRALYVITEYVAGKTLRQWMTDTPQPDLNAVRDIITQISAGLRALHRREMIHQDLRPENIIIDADGTVRIIDLGSAAVAGVEEAAPGLLGELPGTFQYTAPEYLSGDVVSWRSDQYALGAIAYEMLTGRLPYGTKVARIRSRRDQARLTYTSARHDTSGVPDWMDAALKRASHPDPLRRYDALSEFVADLKRPGSTYKADRHVPLAERNPVRFWQTVSLILALICVILAVQLAG